MAVPEALIMADARHQSSVALQMFTLPTSRPGQPKVIDVNMIAGQYSSSTVLM